jgi:hypothetical protein
VASLLLAITLVPAAASEPPAGMATVACGAAAGQRQHCACNTAAGVALLRSTGEKACLLGKTWGYDDTGVWVTDGCAGEFLVAGAAPEGAPAAAAPAPEDAAAPAPEPEPAERAPTEPDVETWGEFDPGSGFLVGRSSAGELSISAYGLVRYINQLPADETFTDHLGNEHPVDTREDLYPHRIMIFFKGWLGSRKFIYNLFLWTVNTTDQDGIFAVLGYQFSQKFSLYGGINGLPGTRSLQGSHPFWLGTDRVMADEFFRPYFSYGIWAQGQLTPGFWYNAMIANNLSALGVKANQLDRAGSAGLSVWWMPTTHEFGPRGSFGDYEMHEKLATRFGASFSYSPEQRYTDANTGATGNTLIRLTDSLNVFDAGSLAPGVTVEALDYRLLAVDLGFKYRGFFFQTELYSRWLNDFIADGPLPVEEIHDTGFYVQTSFFPIPKWLEVYVATSQIYGDRGAGFRDCSEYILGLNFYPFQVRNHRLNLQYIDVNFSPTSSTFGYYVGGQTGSTWALSASAFF